VLFKTIEFGKEAFRFLWVSNGPRRLPFGVLKEKGYSPLAIKSSSREHNSTNLPFPAETHPERAGER